MSKKKSSTKPESLPQKRISAVSFSKITDFEECPYRAYLKYVEKYPEPERPLPPGKTEHANDRGTRIHTDAELFITGKGPLTKELASFEEELVRAKQFFEAGKASVEGNWGFDSHWIPYDFFGKDVMLRAKLDLCVHLEPDVALVVDFKTGKKHGNEVKHTEQGQMYAIATAAKYPKLDVVIVEFWYLDQDEIMTLEYDRAQILAMQPRYQARIDKVRNAVTFGKRANKYSCRWCPYAWHNNGPCEDAIKS